MDEGSQYDDREWTRLFQSIREQPHEPFTAVVADFSQLQPVVSGGMCQRFCQGLDTVELDTVYRSTDEAHLLFCNRIRDKQPTRLYGVRDTYGVGTVRMQRIQLPLIGSTSGFLSRYHSREYSIERTPVAAASSHLEVSDM